VTGSVPPSRYASHLASGLAAYEERTGTRPDPSKLDVTRPQVRALYDQFRARAFPTRLGATEGEWTALQLGLKAVLRERLTSARIETLAQRCAAQGLSLHTVPIAPATGGPLDGLVTAPLNDAHVYVGRDPDTLREAAELDALMVPHQSFDPDGTYEVSRAHNRRLGELLGYPPCCVEWFGQWHERLASNWAPIAASAAATGQFEPLLNNVVLGAFHCIGWFPCRFDCPASLHIAQEVERVLRRTRGDAVGSAFDALRTPRIYLDERRQLVIDGQPDGERIRYRRVYTPYALDRRASTAAYEWVFYADVMPLLARGDSLWREDDALVVAWRDRELGRVEAPNAIWLPFGG